jgi:hypothetical protein
LINEEALLLAKYLKNEENPNKMQLKKVYEEAESIIVDVKAEVK